MKEKNQISEQQQAEINENQGEITQLVLKSFEINAPKAQLSETEMLDYLADVIAYFIEAKLDYLLSLLYRLDIDEQKINFALHPANPEAANITLAKLVWARQKQRAETKKNIIVQRTDNWIWDDEL